MSAKSGSMLNGFFLQVSKNFIKYRWKHIVHWWQMCKEGELFLPPGAPFLTYSTMVQKSW